MASKAGIVKSIKQRVTEIEPFVEEYLTYHKLLETLGEPLATDLKDQADKLVQEKGLGTTKSGKPRQRRRLLATPVSEEVRTREVLQVLMNTSEALSDHDIAKLTPHDATRAAISHIRKQLMDKGFVKRTTWIDEAGIVRKTRHKHQVFVITDKGRELWKVMQEAERSSERREPDRAKITLHAGHGQVH